MFGLGRQEALVVLGLRLRLRIITVGKVRGKKHGRGDAAMVIKQIMKW